MDDRRFVFVLLLVVARCDDVESVERMDEIDGERGVVVSELQVEVETHGDMAGLLLRW